MVYYNEINGKPDQFEERNLMNVYVCKKPYECMYLMKCIKMFGEGQSKLNRYIHDDDFSRNLCVCIENMDDPRKKY